MVKLRINGIEAEANADETILAVADRIDVYIPRLCYHPDLPPAPGLKPTGDVYRGVDLIKNVDPKHEEAEYEGCGLCELQIKGRDGFHRACDTKVEEGMDITSNSPELQENRREKLSQILATHPHACLTCTQREGCSREPCPPNVPVDERCCEKFGRCELQKVAEYVGIKEDTPRYIPKQLPIVKEEPLFVRNYNLCVGCTRCIRACNDLREVEALGFAFDGDDIIVGTKAESFGESGCKFCGACVEVCPTGALLDQEVVWANREEILLPCVHNCPLGIDIPRYIRLVEAGDYTQATAVIREKAPLPSILAHVCHHPCEEKCRRTELNDALCILGLKRVAVENDKAQWTQKLTAAPSTGKRVAIIGSGPAGLTTAYYLTRLGHKVKIFESQAHPGGMLRIGIPSYRLPRNILDSDIDVLTNLGVNIQTNTTIGEDITIPKLQEDGYDAVLVAIGAQASQRLQIKGANLQGVQGGLDFLRRVNTGQKPEIGQRVVIIGGGSVAIDVARAAVRLGAKKVMLTCLETAEEMPAHRWEIEEAVEEGVELNTSWGPNQILGKDGKVTNVELIRCTCVFDEEGCFNPTFDQETTHTVEADTVFLAIGQSVDLSQVGNGIEFQQSDAGTIVIDKATFQTHLPGVFAAGDVVTGPTSVVEAMAASQQAASSIDRYLGGSGILAEEFAKEPVTNHQLGRDEGFANSSRSTLPLLPAEERVKTFDEVELTLSTELAQEEARRCLQCDLRLQFTPIILPPEEWVSFEAECIDQVPIGPGVFTIADAEKTILMIKGTENLRATLIEQLSSRPSAKFFKYEENPLYTQRETELLQQFIQKHGKMPGDDELDELF